MRIRRPLPELSYLRRCKELLPTLETHSMYSEAVFTEVVIKLNHIMQKLDKHGHRLINNSDIDGKHNDITDLINSVRNAACHIDSDDNNIGKIKFIFNTFRGHCPNTMKLGDASFGCDYPDDIAFYYGENRIYYKRHLLKIVDEIALKFEDISNGPSF